MASKTSTTSFDDLPQEMAANILLRLPVKALIRSTLVNKNWYSLITNPNFISTQINRAISHCDDNAVFIVPPLISHQPYCSLVEPETASVIENYDIPFKTRTNSLMFIGSVNGLLLLTDLCVNYSFRDLYLWNPCVKRHKTLVSSCFKKLLDNRGKSYYVAGLGFNKECNDFRIVRIVHVIKSGFLFKEKAAKVEVFSLKTFTWRKLIDPWVPRPPSDYGTFVDGKYYWLDMELEGKKEGRQEMWILTFDFDKEVFGELKLPGEVFYCLGVNVDFRILEFQGSLVVCVTRVDYSNGVASHLYCIWLMSDEDGVISWTLRFRTVLDKCGWPMNITKSGTLIFETHPLGIRKVTNILSCNLNTMHYKDLGLCKGDMSLEDYQLIGVGCVVDTSHADSLAMFERGKSFLKPSEQS